ncbi:lipopolysaccharide biosynthesis protein [Stieleria varia]|uniref:Lipopolysaccharide biosynthesis protein WzxC n=1 Tax=Stieleria varia TaxID=2528005 RepID=A0A5C6AF35_9BACT|nr:lipopolysaccharide biosynthesis protein [Stieleria varia]TWT98632.1 Lipopolysaccharide biosynthesis protein WzxC [Stieleria varia]
MDQTADAQGETLSSIERNQRESGFYIVLQQCVAFAVHFVQVFVLSRLLTSTDYGLAAMAGAIFAITSVFKDFGFSTSTLQVKDLRRQDSVNLFWIGTGMSAAICGVMLLGAPLCAKWFDEPAVIPLMIGYAGIFMLSSLGNQPTALAQRDFRFRELAIWRIAALVVGFFVAVIAAWYGLGAWSIVCFSLSVELISTTGAFWISGFVPGKLEDIGATRSHLKFGSVLTLGGFLGYASANVDRIIIGRYLGPDSLGYYSRAHNLVLVPVTKMLGGFKRFNVAALSQVIEDRTLFKQTIRKLQRLYLVPCTLFLVPAAAFSDDLVMFTMGEKWAPVAPLFAILAPYIWVHITLMICYLAHVAHADIRGLTFYYAICFSLLTVSLAIAARFGLTAVTIAFVLTGLIGVQGLLLMFAGRRGLIEVVGYVADYLVNVIVCVSVFAGLLLANGTVIDFDAPWMNLMCGYCLGFPVMLAAYWAFPRYRETLQSLLSDLKRVWVRLNRPSIA